MTLHTHKENTQSLAHVGLFKEISQIPQAMDLLEQMMALKKYSQGHVLIKEGLEGKEFFVLVEGQVSVLKKTPEGDSYKVAVLKAEQHAAFGEGGLIEGEARSATIVCDTDVECLVLDQTRFNEFSQKHPEFALPILKRVAINLMGRLNQTSNDLMLLHKALMTEIRSS